EAAMPTRASWSAFDPIEEIVRALDDGPEGVPEGAFKARHVCFGWPEWKYVHRELSLSAAQRRIGHRVDFLDPFVRHCVTTNGHAISVYHQRASGTAVCSIERIRITKVERQMKKACRGKL